jgi:uncharacterized protein YdhG (YjbR/CyaY superfamily)
MPAKRSVAREHVQYHKDGTVWAKGQMVNGVATGYWEWFRKDGTKLRSGYFEDGQQVGQWITYDQGGRVYKVTTMKTKPKREAKSKATKNSIDEYLAALPDDKRGVLERLRKTIRTAAPGAEECISYQLPAFRFDGQLLVAFGATAKHCGFYPMSGTAVAAHQDELKGYSTSKGTIRFQPVKPLPAALVRKIVKYRIAENVARRRTAADGAAHP